MTTKKEQIFSVNPCPICDGKLKARGFAWICTNCSYSQGRSYKTDPDGYNIRDKYDKRLERLHYRMQHNLPFEKSNQYLPEELYYYFEQAIRHYCKASPSDVVLIATKKKNGWKISQFCSNAFPTKEECLSQFKAYISSQKELGANTTIIEEPQS